MAKVLAHLPDAKKDLLRELTKRFDLDWSDAKILIGKEAEVAIDRDDDRKSRIAARLVAESKAPDVSQVERQNVIKPDRPKCRFGVDDRVYIDGKRGHNDFDVAEVTYRGFGRTGFWCRLKYHGTDIKYEKGEVEAASLEFIPIAA